MTNAMTTFDVSKWSAIFLPHLTTTSSCFARRCLLLALSYVGPGAFFVRHSYFCQQRFFLTPVEASFWWVASRRSFFLMSREEACGQSMRWTHRPFTLTSTYLHTAFLDCMRIMRIFLLNITDLYRLLLLRDTSAPFTGPYPIFFSIQSINQSWASSFVHHWRTSSLTSAKLPRPHILNYSNISPSWISSTHL